MALINLLIFPGFLFLSVYGLIMEYIDRKVYARLQNRIGPPWYQPLADFLKLLGKETIIPKNADKAIFAMLPIFAIAAATTAFLYVPVWNAQSLYPFEGDLIVVLYVLTIPTLTFFLAGWFSKSVYAAIGSVRVITQLFAYEVPLFMALLSPAILADSWSLSGIAAFYSLNPLFLLCNIPAFFVAVIAAQGKLERTPFDAPEAETEIVAGAFTEYSGRLLAVFRMAIDAELVVLSSIIAAVFMPFFIANPIFGFILYLAKTIVVLFVLTVFRAIMARLRIEQMVAFCWKLLAPIALCQVLLNIIIKGVLI